MSTLVSLSLDQPVPLKVPNPVIEVQAKPYSYDDYPLDALKTRPLSIEPYPRHFRSLTNISPSLDRLMYRARVHPECIELERNAYLVLLKDAQLVVDLESRFNSGKPTTSLAPESGYNIGDHLTACGIAAMRLGLEVFTERLDATEAGELAAKHDLNKRLETCRAALSHCIGQLEKSEDGADKELLSRYNAAVGLLHPAVQDLFKGITASAYSEEAYANIGAYFRVKGTDEDETNLILSAGRYTGHLSFKYLLKIEDGKFYLRTELPLECFVHFIDDITSSPFYQGGTRLPHTYLEPGARMRAGDFKNRYAWMETEGVGMRDDGVIVDIKSITAPPANVTNCVSFMDMQPALSEAIAKFLLLQLGIEQTEPTASAEIVKLVRKLVN